MDKIVIEVGGHKYISINYIAQEIDKWSKRIAMGNDNYRQLMVRILGTIMSNINKVGMRK